MTILKLDLDYTLDEDGQMVLTRDYLLKRGHCCESGCSNCPYGYHDRVDPNFPAELQDPWRTKDESEDFA